MHDRIAHIALKIPKENLFSYKIPKEIEDSVKPGHLVYVPLGRGKAIGLVVDVSGSCPVEPDTLKEVLALPYPDPVMDAQILNLAKWISEYYLCPIGITIRALIPAGVIPEHNVTKEGEGLFRPKGGEKMTCTLSLEKTEAEITEYIHSNKRRAPQQCGILERLVSQGGETPIHQLSFDERPHSPAIDSLVKKGLIRRNWERAFRDPYNNLKTGRGYQEIILTNDQQRVLDELFLALESKVFSPFLLHGVTGSGKTEVYLRLVIKALENGLQSIILVPEISITHQLIDRFKYFLGGRVAILHSHLSEGERLDEWLRIRNGTADVVIGARSAIFAPLTRLGVVICDEEHDPSYKQGSPPRYQGRDVAIMRAKMAGCLICLASATPSLESYYNTQAKKYRLLTLPARVTPNPPPPVRMIDLRKERPSKGDEDNESIFSKGLIEAIKESLEKGEQALIFQNRRGYSPFLLCPKCGYVPKCPNCSVSLTYHKTDDQLRCHYCDHQAPRSHLCPSCPETPLKYMGHGTQKVEEELRGIFSATSIARMDRDTTSRKGAHYKILSRVEEGETDILVGTQMVTKGLHLPKVTVVGVIGADHLLNLPDFRATERVFQVITQVAGRAGRGATPGNVFVQTFYPEHYSLICACRHDYEAFYAREIGLRRRLLYPPFTRLVCLTIKGKERKKTRSAALFIAKQMKSNKPANQIILLGPAMAPLFRIKNNYRYQIMLKSQDYREAHTLVRNTLGLFSGEKEFRGVTVEIDVDPVNLL